ncbi:MAG: hypothetical protein AAFR88_08255 [Pseudomonadota bacterium]
MEDQTFKLAIVLSIALVMTAGWLLNNWIRARHGYPLSDDFTGKTVAPIDKASAENDQLRAENRELHDKLDAMQDRMIVLEKIVTDRGYSLADEIEALRDVPGRGESESGVPLNLSTKETNS